MKQSALTLSNAASAAAGRLDWEGYHRAVGPLWAATRAARHGDPAAVRLLTDFALLRPRFDQSGYLFEAAVGALAVAPASDRGTMHDIVASSATGRVTRETRYVIRLAARYWDGDLAVRLRRLATPASARIAERAQGVRRGYARQGILDR